MAEAGREPGVVRFVSGPPCGARAFLGMIAAIFVYMMATDGQKERWAWEFGAWAAGIATAFATMWYAVVLDPARWEVRTWFGAPLPFFRWRRSLDGCTGVSVRSIRKSTQTKTGGRRSWTEHRVELHYGDERRKLIQWQEPYRAEEAAEAVRRTLAARARPTEGGSAG